MPFKRLLMELQMGRYRARSGRGRTCMLNVHLSMDFLPMIVPGVVLRLVKFGLHTKLRETLYVER